MKAMLVCLVSMFGAGEDNYTVEYTQIQNGPRTEYEGIAAFHITEAFGPDCLYYEFAVPEGHELGGPVLSSDSGQPLLGFDSVTRFGNTIAIEWCIFVPSIQTLPFSIPRQFVFYSLKTKFGPTDLDKLLNDWGLEDSPWDLDLDGTVGGGDLAKLLNGWNGA